MADMFHSQTYSTYFNPFLTVIFPDTWQYENKAEVAFQTTAIYLCLLPFPMPASVLSISVYTHKFLMFFHLILMW